MRLDNYTALITGGASGIGEATVRLFAERGAQVIIADLDEARGKALEDRTGRQGGILQGGCEQRRRG